MRPAIAGLLVAAVGCAHAPRSSVTASSGPRWIELTSRHFALRTDLGRRQARAALADFEGVYETLEKVAFNGDAPRARIDVVLFSDADAFGAVAPRGAAGYFMPRQADDPDPQPTIAIHGGMMAASAAIEATQRRFRHELTHRFLEHRLRWTPPWLEEGLAEYYSTLKVSGGDAVVGTLPSAKILRVDIHDVNSLAAAMIEDRVELSKVPTVEELLRADYATFHDPSRELAYYAGAWVFVHMMLNGPQGYASRFTRFLELLANGSTPPEAWRTSYFGVPLWRLEREFKDYVVRSEMEAHTLTVPMARTVRPDGERVLPGWEVHLMLARIRPWDSRENIIAAGHELDEAQRLAGAAIAPELRYWTALYDARWRRFGEAARQLRAALAVAPRVERYWLALADVLTRGDHPDFDGLDDAVAHLLPLASRAPALNFIARYYSEKGQADAGLPFARRAVAVEKGCWECIDTLAVLQNLRLRLAPAQPVYTKPTIV